MADIRLYGDYHVHSEFSSDGSHTVDQIVREAVARGLKEIAITEHGPDYKGYGIARKNLPLVSALIEKANKEHNITVLQGIESNVTGAGGEIDVTEEMRTDLDILLCGIHAGVKMNSFRDVFTFKIPNYIAWFTRIWTKGRIRKNTEIMKRAIEKNDIDIWVHPNLLFKLDVVEVAKTCAERGTLIELNRRISFRPIDWERMKAVGAKFIINSDFHNFDKHNLGGLSKAQEDFLEQIDWEPSDFINMTGEFRRGDANLLSKIKETQYDKPMIEPSKKTEKLDKKKVKEQKRLERAIKKKKV